MKPEFASHARKNKRVILLEGGLWAVHDGLTAIFLAAFALALGASNTLIGLLGALPFLAQLLTQIPGAGLVQLFSRKKIYIIFNAVSRLSWIGILISPYLFTKPLLAVTIFYFVSRLGVGLSNPAWTSLLADIVGVEERGDFFAKRFQIIGFAGLVATALGGVWLKQFPGHAGFATMFFAGVIIGLVALRIVSGIKEPAYVDHDHHRLKDFFTLKGSLKNFVMFTIIFHFAYMLASPLFTVYMLKNLRMNYEFYGISVALSTLASILVAGPVGRLSDRLGDKTIALLSHFGTALVPLWFMFIRPEYVWLVIPAQIFSGAVWAGADITRFNLLLDLTEKKKRALQIAEYSVYGAIPLIIAPVIGGWLSEHVSFVLAGIPFVFGLSAMLRILSTLFLLGIPEPRAKQEAPFGHVFREILHFHPTKGFEHSISAVKHAKSGKIKLF